MYGSHQKEREAMATVAPATRAEAPLRILKETAVPDSRAYGVVASLVETRSDHSTHLWVVAVHSEPTFMDIAAVLSVVSVVLVVSVVVAGVVAAVVAGVSAARTMGA